MSSNKIIFLISFLFFSVANNAQSLLQDTENLLGALDLLNNRDKLTEEVNVNASASVLEILRKYDRSFQVDTLNAVTGRELMGSYAQHTVISNILSSNQEAGNLAGSPSYVAADATSMQSELQDVLNQLNNGLYQLDSLLTDASAKALAILFNYDQTIPGDSMAVGTWQDLVGHYENNVLLNDLVRLQTFNLKDSIPARFLSTLQSYIHQIAQGPRQKILERLHAQNAISPADYLSVKKTLEQYAIPPVSQTMALSRAAEESNTNVRNGFLVSEAAIIQGMFKFVLERAKDEVVINYLGKLVKEDTPRLISLFPTVVEEFGEQDFTYSNSYIERIRQAFYEDMQKMSIRLPLLMLEDDYFKPLQGDPVAYDLLSIYSMIGMAQQGATLDEIFPVTHRYLYKGYREASKEVNLTLAETAFGSPEYEKLIDIVTSVKDKMKDIYSDLEKAEAEINASINNFESNFPDASDTPLGNDFLGRPTYSLKVLLGEENKDNEFDLFILPSLLKGELDSTYIVGFNTLQGYDKFFKNEKSATQWRASGLELSRRLSGTWYSEQTMAGILHGWQKDLVRYKKAVDYWQQSVDTQGVFQKARQAVDNDRDQLFQIVNATKKFWVDSIGLTHDQGLAFSLLANLSDKNAFKPIDNNPKYFKMRFEGVTKAIIDQLKLQAKQDYLTEVVTRLTALDQRLRDENPDFFFPSPLQLYQEEKNLTTIPFSYIIPKIESLTDLLTELDHQLMVVDSTFAPVKFRARNNARPILQITEVMTQLLYGLRSDSNQEGEKWLTKDQFSDLLDGGDRQNIFLGLLSQRFAGVKEIGKFSPEGVAQLAQLTIAELRQLPAFSQTDSLGQQDSLAFFRKAAFAVNTLNRVLELPLVVQPNAPGTFKPLKDQWPGLSKVPEISTQALDFIYFINAKEHGRAVSTLIRLFTSLDYQTLTKEANNPKMEKRTEAILYLKKYGNFIAGLIDAEQSDQVKDLLDNIADPPGSSRTKRRNNLTVGLNAFLGANVGIESWTGGTLGDKKDEFYSLAPTMPFGFAISGLLGKNNKQSFSLFLSLIDLGGLFSYRINDVDTTVLGENSINFKNVFKPGMQLQWNLMNSPFYLSTGAHFGPQYRTLNNETISFGARRFFVGFGVDVPVFTFYTR